jgi:hypothetical protein
MTREHLDPHPSIDGLSPTARHLLEVLSNLAYSDNVVRDHSVATLAKRMGVTAATVRRARARLVSAGLIQVEPAPSTGTDRDVNRYRFPLGAPVEIVHTPRATARGSDIHTRAPARGTPARHRAIRDPLEPLVTDTYAVQRGGDSIGDGPEPWRAVMHAALAADDARRAAEGK